MNDWIMKNGLSIGIAVVGIIATYSINTALYGYRLNTVEARQDRQGAAITTLQDKQTDTLVALAKIQTDIDYIKIQLNKIVP